MLSLLILHTADDKLGRLDYASVNDQSKMEIVVSLRENTSFKDDDDTFCDIHEWKGLTFDENDTLTQIEWFDPLQPLATTGALRLEWLPETVSLLDIRRCGVEGTVDFARLPAALVECMLSYNALTGSADLLHLPAQLKELLADCNKLSGSLTLHALPVTMTDLCLDHNEFFGSVDLSKLPPALEFLRLDANKLSGEVLMQGLPESLENLNLGQNGFSGNISLEDLPETLEVLYLRENQFSGVLDASSTRDGLLIWYKQNKFSEVKGIKVSYEED